jgi:hypothetical protein
VFPTSKPAEDLEALLDLPFDSLLRRRDLGPLAALDLLLPAGGSG